MTVRLLDWILKTEPRLCDVTRFLAAPFSRFRTRCCGHWIQPAVSICCYTPVTRDFLSQPPDRLLLDANFNV